VAGAGGDAAPGGGVAPDEGGSDLGVVGSTRSVGLRSAAGGATTPFGVAPPGLVMDGGEAGGSAYPLGMLGMTG